MDGPTTAGAAVGDAVTTIETSAAGASAKAVQRVVALGRTIRKKSLAALVLEEEQSAQGSAAVPSLYELPEHLKIAAFSDNSALQRQAALELARAEQFAAAQNYLQLYFLYEPPSSEVDMDLMRAVTDSRPIAARRAEALTWDGFSSDWRGRLRIAHHVLISSNQQRQPSADQRAWIKMLIKSPSLFGGPASHLICALAELVKAKLGDSNRFEPPAKVMALNEPDKYGRYTWQHGEVLNPEEEGRGGQGSGSSSTNPSARTPPKAKPATAASSTSVKKGAAAGKPSGSGSASSSSDGLKKQPPKANPEALVEAQEAEAAAKALAAVKASREPPPLRVKLKATSEAPQRTAYMKRSSVMRDVEVGSPKAYLPGLMLLEAAALGRVEVLTALLDVGVSGNEVDDEANNVLLHASFNCTTAEHQRVCQYLFDRGFSADVTNMNGMSPWDCALLRRDTKLRRTFRPSESDRDFTPKARVQTELHRAIDAGDETMARAELGNPVNLEIAKMHGVTPLMMACRAGMPVIVQALLSRGANAALKSEHGCTALYLAAEEGFVDIVKEILGSGSPPGTLLAADVTDTNPLMRACENGHLSTAALLLQQQTSEWNVNSINKKGWTALMMAACQGFTQVVELLLAQGARVDVFKKDAKLHSKGGKYTALCYACTTGRIDVVKLLLAGEYASLAAQKAETALALAEQGEHELCAAELRSVGAEGCESAEQAGMTGATGTDGDTATPAKDKSPTALTNAPPASVPAAGAPATNAPATGAPTASASSTETSTPANDTAKPAKRERPKPKDPNDPAEIAAKLQALELQETELSAKIQETKDELMGRRAEKKLREASLTKEERAAQRKAEAEAGATKSPWAFSPSGKWRPGLWQGPLDRSQPCHHGEPAHSIAFVDGCGPEWSGLLTA